MPAPESKGSRPLIKDNNSKTLVDITLIDAHGLSRDTNTSGNGLDALSPGPRAVVSVFNSTVLCFISYIYIYYPLLTCLIISPAIDVLRN